METETVWSFDTDNYRVSLEVEPEELDPADCFELPEDIEAVRSGNVLWFAARAVVYFKRHRYDEDPEPDYIEIGSDALGGCAYKSMDEFLSSHRDPDPMNRNCSIMRAACGENTIICHHFPSMIHEAIADARKTLAKLTSDCAA